MVTIKIARTPTLSDATSEGNDYVYVEAAFCDERTLLQRRFKAQRLHTTREQFLQI